MNIDTIMKELAEYIRMNEEIAANIDALKDVLKQYMILLGGCCVRIRNTGQSRTGHKRHYFSRE